MNSQVVYESNSITSSPGITNQLASEPDIQPRRSKFYEQYTKKHEEPPEGAQEIFISVASITCLLAKSSDTSVSQQNRTSRVQFKEDPLMHQRIKMINYLVRQNNHNSSEDVRYYRFNRLQALKMIEQIFQFSDRCNLNNSNKSLLYYYRGVLAQRKESLDHAASDYQTAIELDQNNLQAAYSLAACENMRGNFDKALDDYQQALDAEMKRPSSLTRVRSLNQDTFFRFSDLESFDKMQLKSPQPYKMMLQSPQFKLRQPSELSQEINHNEILTIEKNEFQNIGNHTQRLAAYSPISFGEENQEIKPSSYFQNYIDANIPMSKSTNGFSSTDQEMVILDEFCSQRVVERQRSKEKQEKGFKDLTHLIINKKATPSALSSRDENIRKKIPDTQKTSYKFDTSKKQFINPRKNVQSIRDNINQKENQSDAEQLKKFEIPSGEVSRITPYSTSQNCSRISFQNGFPGLSSANFTPTIKTSLDKALSSCDITQNQGTLSTLDNTKKPQTVTTSLKSMSSLSILKFLNSVQNECQAKPKVEPKKQQATVLTKQDSKKVLNPNKKSRAYIENIKKHVQGSQSQVSLANMKTQSSQSTLFKTSPDQTRVQQQTIQPRPSSTISTQTHSKIQSRNISPIQKNRCSVFSPLKAQKKSLDMGQSFNNTQSASKLTKSNIRSLNRKNTLSSEKVNREFSNQKSQPRKDLQTQYMDMISSGKLKECIQALTSHIMRASFKHIDRYLVFYIRGLAFFQQKNYELAEQDLTASFQCNPSFALSSIYLYYYNCQLYRAIIKFKQHRYFESLQDAQRATEILDVDKQSKEWRLAFYFQAKSCYKLGSYLESLSSCEEILEYIDFSDPESSQEIFRVSLIVQKDQVMIMIGKSYLRLGQYEQVTKVLEKIDKSSDMLNRDHKFYILQCQLHCTQQKINSYFDLHLARDSIEKQIKSILTKFRALQIKPNQKKSILLRAYINKKLGFYMEAIQDFQQVNKNKINIDEIAGSVVELDSQQSQVFVNFEISKCYEKLGEPQLALFYLQKDLDLVFKERVVSTKFSDDQILRSLRQKVHYLRLISTTNERITEDIDDILQSPILYQKHDLYQRIEDLKRQLY